MFKWGKCLRTGYLNLSLQEKEKPESQRTGSILIFAYYHFLHQLVKSWFPSRRVANIRWINEWPVLKGEAEPVCREQFVHQGRVWCLGNSRFSFLDRNKKWRVKWRRERKKTKDWKRTSLPGLGFTRQWDTAYCPFIHLFHNYLLNVRHMPRHCAQTWGSNCQQNTVPPFKDHAAFRREPVSDTHWQPWSLLAWVCSAENRSLSW